MRRPFRSLPFATLTSPRSTLDSTTSGFDRRALLVLVLATLTLTLTGPGQTIGVAVFTDHLVADLGLGRSEVSTAYLIGTLVGAALLPWVGRAIDRRGVRLAQMVIATAFAAALFGMSLVDGFVALALGFTGIRFLGQGSLSLVATVTVSVHFVRNRGTALGIFNTATGALMALVPVVVAVLIDAVGWRDAWRVLSVVILVVVVPIAAVGYRNLPRGSAATATPSLQADGAAPSDTSSTEPASTQPASPEPASTDGPAFERGEAVRTPQFWMLAVTNGTAGMLVTGLNFHQIDLLGRAGLSATAAAALFIPQMVGSTAAGLIVGTAADRLGTRYIPALGMGLLTAAHLLAAVVGPGPLVLAYSVVLGATGAALRTGTSTMLPDWYGVKNLGAIQGLLNLFTVGGSALGPVALAVVEGRFGSYRPAVLTLSLFAVAAAVFALQPWTTSRPRHPDHGPPAPSPTPG
ncbi:MAG: MFS transporter [Actinomycetota bacterium]